MYFYFDLAYFHIFIAVYVHFSVFIYSMSFFKIHFLYFRRLCRGVRPAPMSKEREAGRGRQRGRLRGRGRFVTALAVDPRARAIAPPSEVPSEAISARFPP